VTRVQVIVWG